MYNILPEDERKVNNRKEHITCDIIASPLNVYCGPFEDRISLKHLSVCYPLICRGDLMFIFSDCMCMNFSVQTLLF